MKKLIVILSTVFLLAGVGFGFCEEGPRLDGLFIPQTKDFESESIGNVIVNQTYNIETKLTWSLDEIDSYITVYQNRIDSYQKYIDRLKELRKIIEKEAVKVKLKAEGDKNT
uniref:Uncharacterized protein n=1 Tax=viral metagenome TaxID=1070528 RepID=A0A6M3KNL3_9ZZZZ